MRAARSAGYDVVGVEANILNGTLRVLTATVGEGHNNNSWDEVCERKAACLNIVVGTPTITANAVCDFARADAQPHLTGIPWSEDFMRQYAAAFNGVKEQIKEVGAGRTDPGSFNALCVSYHRSPEFHDLKPSTQVMRRNIIEKFRLAHGSKLLKGLGVAHIKAIIGAKADTPEAANNLLKVLRVILGYAVSVGMIASNPAAGVKKYRSRGEGFHSWSEDEIAQFEERHEIGSRTRLAFALLLYTAQRRSDVVRMGLAACARRRRRSASR